MPSEELHCHGRWKGGNVRLCECWPSGDWGGGPIVLQHGVKHLDQREPLLTLHTRQLVSQWWHPCQWSAYQGHMHGGVADNGRFIHVVLPHGYFWLIPSGCASWADTGRWLYGYTLYHTSNPIPGRGVTTRLCVPWLPWGHRVYRVSIVWWHLRVIVMG